MPENTSNTGSLQIQFFRLSPVYTCNTVDHKTVNTKLDIALAVYKFLFKLVVFSFNQLKPNEYELFTLVYTFQLCAAH